MVQQLNEPVMAFVIDLLVVEFLHVLEVELALLDLLDNVLALLILCSLNSIFVPIFWAAAQEKTDVHIFVFPNGSLECL